MRPLKLSSKKNFLKGLQLLMNKDMTYEKYTEEDAHYER